MKYALLLTSAAVLGVLFFQLVHFRVSWVIHFYVLWMAFVAVFACYVIYCHKNTDPQYAAAYAFCVGTEVLVSLCIASRFALSLGWDGFIGLGIFIAVGIFFAGAIRHRLPETPQARIMLLFGCGYCVAGLLALAALIPQCSALQFKLRFFFCLYWLANSVYHFAESVGIVRNRAMWESIDNWLSATLCIVFMTGLVLSLRGQAELGRQHSVDEQAVELIWEQP